jgi:autotransporter translocation and assembly factor TamB
MVMVGDSYLTINGEGNFKDNTIDIMAELEQAEIELVNQFLPGNFMSGRATGRLKVQGDFYSPSANAELICDDIKFDDFELKSLELNCRFFNSFGVLIIINLLSLLNRLLIENTFKTSDPGA